MGDIADSIIDGEFCQSCGEYIGEPVGYPRDCASCGGGDDEFALMKAERQVVKEQRRNVFIDQILPKVIRFAKEHGLVYRKLTDYQYRVQNNRRQFVDMWTTRAMRDVDGKTGGFGLNEKYLWRELNKLTT